MTPLAFFPAIGMTAKALGCFIPLRVPILCSVLAAILILSASDLHAQVAVYKYSDRGTWVYDGVEYKMSLEAYWFVQLGPSLGVVKIYVFPSSMEYIAQATTEDFVEATGKNAKSYVVLGSAKSREDGSFLQYLSLVGVRQKVALGGSYGNTNIPKSFKGHSFDSRQGDKGDFTQKSALLVLDSKATQSLNNQGQSALSAAQAYVDLLRSLGYRGFPILPFD